MNLITQNLLVLLAQKLQLLHFEMPGEAATTVKPIINALTYVTASISMIMVL